MGNYGLSVKVAVRALIGRPGYTVVMLATLIASVGSATLVFSVLEGVLLRPLPYAEADRIYRLYGTNPAWREAEQEVLRDSWDQLEVSRDVIEAVRTDVTGIESIGGVDPTDALWYDGGAPARLQGGWITPGFLSTLRLDPVLGRLPSDDEVTAGEPVLVLSESLWTRRYGRDPDILGRSVALDETTHTVVGVLSAAFDVPSSASEWWAPWGPDFAEGRTDIAVFEAYIRLAGDGDAAAVGERLHSAATGLAESNPGYRNMGVRTSRLDEEAVSDVRDGIHLLFLAVGVIVLIASVNLANLVVARGARRRPELAMRAALGADRGSLIWDTMAETVVLCVVGGTLGVLVATQLIDPFLALLTRAADAFPRTENVSVNGLVLAFALGVTLLTAVLAGLLPAIAASRRAPWEAMQGGRRTGGRTARRTQYGLLTVEAGLAIVLLVIGGLLIRSAWHVVSVDPGFEAQSVAFISLETSSARYESEAEVEQLGGALEARMRRLPGVVSVARTTSLPALGSADGDLIWRTEQNADEGTLVWSSGVSGDYFRTVGIPLVSGRSFVPSDGEGAEPVVIVSELFAERFFPGEDPVGRSLKQGKGTRMEAGGVVADGEITMTVVGVVSDIRQLALVLEPDPMIYRPIAQAGGEPHLVVRTTEPPREVLEAMRTEVLAEDPGLLIQEVDVLQRAARRVLGALGVRTVLLVALAAIAAFLTVVGIYGVVAYVVSDRVHEIGLRIALGARSSGETGRIVRFALRPIAVGAVLGVCGAWAATRLVEGSLFGVEPIDLPTFGTVVVVLLGVAAMGAWIPARRATAVDPMRVLSRG